MKKIKLAGVIAASAALTQFVLFAAETNSRNALEIQNRVRAEYDDNIYETNSDKTDSFKIIEELELGLTFDFQPTFITLRYRPTFTWWSDREPDDTDLHHDFDFVLNHSFSPRLSFGLKNTLRLAELPEEIDRGTVLRQNDDYLYNVTDANVDYELASRTHAVVGGRYTVLRYDRDEVAATEDYDIAAGGLTLRHRATDMTQVLGDFRYETVSYDLSERDSDSIYAGLGVEHVIGASFVGTLRGGYQRKDFNDDSIDNESQPYADGSLTYIISPRSRLSVGAGYSMFEADVYPFASQDRTIVFASFAHDLTAKISVFLSASYQKSKYTADQAITSDPSVPAPEDGDEKVAQGAVRVSYQVNARNSLELNLQTMDLNSDVRENFDRNRASIGWRLDI